MLKKMIMHKKERRKKYFVGMLLLLMVLLTVGTIGLAASGDWDADGSYSLVIIKKFDENDTPDEVIDAAKGKKYTFQITGTRKKSISDGGYEDVNVDTIVTLPRDNVGEGEDPWTSETFKSSGPFYVTVTEITDNIDINIQDDEGNYYNMSDSKSDAAISVNTRTRELELKNNSRLTISRLAADSNENSVHPCWYHIHNRQEDEHTSPDFKKIDEYFPLNPGEEKLFEGLRAGIYTIEQIAAPDGYQLQMGTRKETVNPGEVGRFYINGTPGSLTLTAGGNESNNVSYYYIVDRTETEEGDTSTFQPRTVSIQSGKSVILDNLPKGGYTVTEFTVSASEKSIVTTPTTDERIITGKSSALSKETKNNWKYIDFNDKNTTNYKNFDVDYIKMVSFGPLYNSKNQKLNSSTSYTTFRYGFLSEDTTLITGIKSYSRENGYTGNLTITMSDAKKMSVKPHKRLYFTATGVKSTTAKTIGVSWIEYDEKETLKTFKNVATEESVTVDERGWIKIEAPALQNPSADGADKISYYYTIKDKDGNLIPGGEKTDDPETTIKLQPGSNMTLEGLNEGTYTITEMIKGNAPAGFTMKISGMPFGTTENGKEIKVNIGGKRDLIITKLAPVNLSGNAADNRTYKFNIRGGAGFNQNVTIEAGKNSTIALPDAGLYTIQPINDQLETYNLNYTDSGAIYGTAFGSTSEITFTNHFASGTYGYRYIHEYYVKTPDGTYIYEGQSPITTRLGRPMDETYTAKWIDKVTDYNNEHYTHFDEAYGIVDGIEQKNQADSDNSSRTYSITRSVASPSSSTASPSSARARQNHDSDKPYRQTDSAASPSRARSRLNNTASKTLGSGSIAVDDQGIIRQGKGTDSWEKTLNYAPVDGKEYIDVTEDASQIIILRYCREQRPMGKYNIIHVYYCRDDEGSHWEGVSSVRVEEAELESKHVGENVPKECSFTPEPDNDFTPEITKKPYNYTWDTRPQYGELDRITDSDSSYQPGLNGEYAGDNMRYRPNNDWTFAKATKEGNHIIILCYYREPAKEGNYNIVHEYYLRKKSESHEDEEIPSRYKKMIQPQNDDAASGEDNEVSSETEDKEDSSGDFTGTLNVNDGYVYTFEGSVGDDRNPIIAPLETTRKAAESDWKINYNNHNYTHLNDGYGSDYTNNKVYRFTPSQQWAASTENENQVIILRYYRDEPDKPDPTPEVSYNYVHEYYLKHPDGSLTLEGKSDIGTVPNADADKEYTGEDVSRIPDYKGTTYTYYECGYGNVSDSSYKEDEGKKFVKATESGDQIIILRYYREESTKDPDPSPKVSYKYIHEYYFKHPDGSLTLEGKSDIGTVPDAKAGVEYNYKNVTQVPDYEGKTYTYFNCGYGAMFSDKDYSELPDKTFIYATESGEQIIILRYEREEKPDDPKPSGGGGRKHSDPDPKPTPAPTTVPEPVPEVPTVPVVESVPETSPVPEPDTPVLPDPNLPGSPERITIMDGGVPKTYIKVWNPTTEEYVYLEEDDVPLTGLNDPSLPRTSDNTNFFLWISLVSSSLGGIIIIGYRRFRKEH